MTTSATTTGGLSAPLNVATGEVLHDAGRSHTGKDVLAFLKLIDLHVPPGLAVQLCSTTSRPRWAQKSPAGLTTPTGFAGTFTSPHLVVVADLVER